MPSPSDSLPPLHNVPSFIEKQFPVAKISMESYKERTAKQSQTLTGLGKWWGRKPLILVRAALLGLLMPASENPEKDREIFLKLLTMDKDGLLLRKSKPISGARLVEEVKKLSPAQKKRYLDSANADKLKKLSKEEKAELQTLVFERMNYAEKLEYCDRPEHVEELPAETWVEVTAHLGTRASNLPDLIQQLGERRFGHTPRVGDAFAGGGSIPFEAARIGCEVFASDLNPAAALLTWASLNVIGGGEEVIATVMKSQEHIYSDVDKQITKLGIEHNKLGWRADYFLYCAEVTDPESGWKVPLLPTLVIGRKSNAIVKLVPDLKHKRYDMEILEGVSDEEMERANEMGTIKDSRVYSPAGGTSTPVEVIRQGMRFWENSDVAPQETDVFQERLYCIRWIETITDKDGKTYEIKHYRSPDADDLKRENKVKELLLERFEDWQKNGYIPSRKIESGQKTDEPIRTRGWTYWHHLFTPRQLFTIGLLSESIVKIAENKPSLVGALLGVGRCADWNSKLCRWVSDAANEKTAQTFSNQALNTLVVHGCRGFTSLDTTYLAKISNAPISGKAQINIKDARRIETALDIWITDPPYADAVNYEEITEYFLAWYQGWIQKAFPDWYTDSKRALAIKGNDQNFRQSMLESYRRLANTMPENGMQIVMFTHQDAGVWADLTSILWAAGLRVTAAWTIATEIATALKEGNYVQGTVLLILRKRIETEPVFLDEVNQKVEAEVRRQLDEMTQLEDDSDPNFGDSDYQLAAYAAALRVLTSQPIEEINPEREILRERRAGEANPIEDLIRRAVKIACDHLIPRRLDPDLWKELDPMERFYLKGLEVESHGEYRSGVYQELARGFGATEYTELLQSTKANETRLKSAGEFGKRNLSGDGFAGSLVRQCLFAVHQTAKTEEPREGLNYLKTELNDYWTKRERIIHLLDYLASLRNITGMEHWSKDAHAASLLVGMVRNDHV